MLKNADADADADDLHNVSRAKKNPILQATGLTVS
jgi:hypothetical protein